MILVIRFNSYFNGYRHTTEDTFGKAIEIEKRTAPSIPLSRRVLRDQIQPLAYCLWKYAEKYLTKIFQCKKQKIILFCKFLCPSLHIILLSGIIPIGSIIFLCSSKHYTWCILSTDPQFQQP